MHHLGHTRSANRRDHLLHTPDAFIRTPLPGLPGGLAIVHIAPAAGAEDRVRAALTVLAAGRLNVESTAYDEKLFATAATAATTID